MSYTKLDRFHDENSGKEFGLRMAMEYAAHMSDFDPVAVPVVPSSPPCLLSQGSAPGIRRSLAPSLFVATPWPLWCKKLLDLWTSQFVMMGYFPTSAGVPYPGAFSPGPAYSAAFAKLQAVSVKTGSDFSVKNRKFSSWARDHERVFAQTPGFVMFTGNMAGMTFVYNISMVYKGS